MKTYYFILPVLSLALTVSGCGLTGSTPASMSTTSIPSSAALVDDAAKTEADWKKILTPEQYAVLREKGTERPFSNQLDFETRPGTYVTADCNEPVFRSEQKYYSGTGWPSFWAPIKPDAIVTTSDGSAGMDRTEVLSKCGGHLGHVFTDGPQPTGLRYCINGTALKFIPDDLNSATTIQ